MKKNFLLEKHQILVRIPPLYICECAEAAATSHIGQIPLAYEFVYLLKDGTVKIVFVRRITNTKICSTM